MERLTKRIHNGEAAMDCDSCGLKTSRKCTLYKCRNQLMKRVAAYEDTNLTPEDLNAPFTWQTVLNQAAQKALGLEPSRLRELAEADKAGRVVVLPCKVGDELWTYCDHPIKRVYSFTVSDVSTMNGRTVLNTLGLGTIRPEDIGKTVFFTREEAERAMEGRKDG